MKYSGKLTDRVCSLISLSLDEGHNVELFYSSASVRLGLEPNQKRRYMHKVELNNDRDPGVHGDGVKFIRGRFMTDAVIWGHESEAMEVYIAEYATSEDDCVTFCPTDGYHWNLQITPSDEA